MPPIGDDWSWFAGLFEGEGTAGNYPAKNRSRVVRDRLVVTVAQKERSMLDDVKRITGVGSIHYQKSWDGYAWVAASRSARVVLTRLYPYLRSPRRQAQVAAALVNDARIRLEAAEAQKRHLATTSRFRNTETGRYIAKVS